MLQAPTSRRLGPGSRAVLGARRSACAACALPRAPRPPHGSARGGQELRETGGQVLRPAYSQQPHPARCCQWPPWTQDLGPSSSCPVHGPPGARVPLVPQHVSTTATVPSRRQSLQAPGSPGAAGGGCGRSVPGALTALESGREDSSPLGLRSSRKQEAGTQGCVFTCAMVCTHECEEELHALL